MSTWWGTRKEPSRRMRVEILAMKKLFNTKQKVLIKPRVLWDDDFYLITKELNLDTDNRIRPFWLTTFRMRSGPQNRINPEGWYTLRITYRSEFPAKEPAATIPSHGLLGAEHIFGKLSETDDYVLCLTGHDGIRSGWDPARSTAATIGLWSIEWIRAWTLSIITGYWPDEA